MCVKNPESNQYLISIKQIKCRLVLDCFFTQKCFPGKLEVTFLPETSLENLGETFVTTSAAKHPTITLRKQNRYGTSAHLMNAMCTAMLFTALEYLLPQTIVEPYPCLES